MKVCRLKIITGNISGEIDTPKIHYVSQNKISKIITNNNNSNENINLIHNIDDKIIQKELLEKITEDKNQNQPKEINNYSENKNTANINENGNELNNNNIDVNIDINDLCTISNTKIIEDHKIDNILNYIDKNFTADNNNKLNNNYPYEIMNKKKGLNNSLRCLFKNRETRVKNNKNVNESSHKSLSISKNSNSNSKIIRKNFTKNSKSNLNLNQTINKSSGLKNCKSTEFITLKKSKNTLLNKSNNNTNTNNSNKKSTKTNILRGKKSGYPMTNENSISMVAGSWKISEKNEYNIGQTIDYKTLIDDLIIKECQLVKEKEQFIQIFENKLKPLRELNNKLLDDNNGELNREDELNGEMILLKSQYEQLFNSLDLNDKKLLNNKEKNIKNKNIINKNNFDDKEFNKKKKEIDDEIKVLNDKLKNGEFLFITKPANYQKLSEEEIQEMTLLLKALFFSRHILDTNIIVDKIWKSNKQIQTIYFLVEELLHLFNIEHNDRNELINYFYSFCKNYNYIDKAQFKSEFSKKIGKIKIFNKYIYISKLLNFHKSKIIPLMNTIKKKDLFNRGIIKYYQFINLLQDNGINFNLNSIDNKNNEELLEFLIFCMKKDRRIGLFEENEKFTDNKNEEEKKYSLFDLYYESLEDFINEFNSNDIINPYLCIRNYMKENDIINAEKLLKPVFNDKNILIKNNVKYIDIIVLNKFLKFKGIIKNEDKIIVNTFEEELVDIDQFINDIYNEDNQRKKTDYEEVEVKHKAENLIDDILKLNY